MKTVNPYFVIGTIGLIVTAVMHTLSSLLTDSEGINRAFKLLYPIFAALLTIGGMQILAEKKMVKLRVRARNKR